MIGWVYFETADVAVRFDEIVLVSIDGVLQTRVTTKSAGWFVVPGMSVEDVVAKVMEFAALEASHG